MAQFYLLSELYLFVWTAVLLSYRYGTKVLILINIRNIFENSSRNRIISLVLGVIIVLGLCFMPLDPGPAFLGDLIPALTVLALVLYQVLNPLDKVDGYGEDGQKGIVLGYISFAVASIHLLFPSIVLI
ncbi:MAG: hypothetical protein K6F82_00595 [Sphaerochaetaceae bacterium]|nr:hypothetical protein [Sphaerochaetaceae bacterium]